MTSQEQDQIGQLQGRAAALWAEATAVAALAEDAHDAQPVAALHVEGRKPLVWDTEVGATAALAKRLAEGLAELASDLDFLKIQNDARNEEPASTAMRLPRVPQDASTAGVRA